MMVACRIRQDDHRGETGEKFQEGRTQGTSGPCGHAQAGGGPAAHHPCEAGGVDAYQSEEKDPVVICRAAVKQAASSCMKL